MKKFYITILLIGLIIPIYSQVGIGTITPSGALEVSSTNDGLLIPRIALTNTTTATVITPIKSELIYNTATAGDVTPGYYYWETTPTVVSNRWVRLISSLNTSNWSTTGNTGTNPTTNFAGTIDNIGYAIRTNNTEKVRITPTGELGIGTTTPNGALEVSSTSQGIVPTRVALTASNVATPIVNPQGGALLAGTFVWNTATAGTSPNNVAPGLYFWSGTRWIAFAGSAGGIDWSLQGNTGTTVGTHFLGTLDAVDFRVKTNNTDRWNISNTNNGQLQSYSLGNATSPTYSWQSDTDTGIFSSSANILAIATNGAERMRVEADGDVAIGAITGSNKLHVVNNADGQGVFRVDNGTAGGFSGVYFYQGTNYRGHIGYVNTGGASSFGGKGYYQLAAGSRPIIFSTDPGASELYQERVVIAQDGRVGINTNPTNLTATIQPTSTLQVNGSLAMKIVSIASTSTLANDVCKIILSNGATNITITLPDPSTCVGRLISFSRNPTSTGSVTLSPSTGTIQNLDGTATATTTVGSNTALGGGVNIQFWSNGSTWFR